MTLRAKPMPLSWLQVSPPEAHPSRLAAGQRRDKRYAPQALSFMTAAIRPTGLPQRTAPAPSASPPPRGKGFGEWGTPDHQEVQT